MTADPGGAPLARLFAMAFRDLIEALHQRLAGRGFTDVRPAFGFVLVALRDRHLGTTDIAGLMGITKQAASKLVAALESAGYASHRPHPADGRAKQVALTPRGAALLAAADEIYAELEGEWAAVIGRPAVEALRRDLTAVLTTTHGGRLPPARPA